MAEKGQRGLSNTQDSRTDSYSAVPEKQAYSPAKRLQGFGTSHSLTAGNNPLHTLEQHPVSLCSQTTTSQTVCSGQWGLTAARTRPLTHRHPFCQDTHQHFFFHSSPRCCRHNREPSPSSCCKADLSKPWISPRETGDTRPLLSSTSRSVKHPGCCRFWSWSSSNFRQKSKSRQNPWSSLLCSQQHSKAHCATQGIFIKPFLMDRVFCFSRLLGQRAPTPVLGSAGNGSCSEGP